jgi:tetratricopeptide (TPR) repeat protein
MDSDDTIDETNGQGLRNLARRPHHEQILGYVIRVHCPGAGPDGMSDMTVVDHVKLFRNRPDLRFEHRIHEQILPAIRKAGGEVRWSDLFVLHSGYDHTPDGQARKKDRDIRLLHLDLAERPGHPFTLFNLGMTYADFGEHAKAAGYLEESLRASMVGDSHRRKAFALLAHSRSRIGDLQGALATCETGLTECPEDLELRFRLGVLLHEAGRLRDSVAAYEQVLAHRGERYFTSVDRGIGGFKARQNLAVIYGELGDSDRAEEAWRAVTKEAPEYRLGWRGYGEFLVRYRKIDEAAAVATQLIGNPRTAIEGHLLTGMVEDARGFADEARRAWEKAASMDSTDPEPLRHLGRIHFEAGKDDLAERVLRSLTAIASTDASAHHNLGSVLLRTGRNNEAVQAFQRSLGLRPDSIDTRMCLGYALRAIGDRAGAGRMWRSVLSTQPGHREAVDALEALHSFPG